MNRRVSYPTPGRRIGAALLLMFVLSVALTAKVARDFSGLHWLRPLDAGGLSPNFFLPLALPFGFLIVNRSISWPEFSRAAMGTGAGFLVYEVLQLWMPWRTFDFLDMVATVAGFTGALVLARLTFFRGAAIL